VVAIRRFLKRFLLAFAVALPVGLAIGYFTAGWPGFWGVLMGLGVLLAFFGISVAVALLGANWSPQTLGAAVLGSYLVKVALLIIILAAVSGLHFYNKAAFGITVLVGTVLYLTAETWTLLKARIPYVEPTSAG
jgi:hypothetical protein